MQPNPLPNGSRFENAMEWTFLVIFGLLFVYALVGWLDLLPSVRVNRPHEMLFLTAGLFMQPLAALLRRRSRALSYVILAASVVPLLAAIGIVAS